MEERRVHTDYISTSRWFAWYPVRTDKKIVWLRYVNRTVDDRPVEYLGLLPEITYEEIE